MHPEATPEQEELRTAVRAFCAREVTMERLLEWEGAPEDVSPSVREAVAKLGWFGLGLGAEVGGGGASFTDVSMLVAEAARGLLPRSLLGAVRNATAMGRIAPHDSILPALANGATRLACAIDEVAARDSASFETLIEGQGDEETVRGAKAYVPDARTSDLHVVAANHDGSCHLVVVDVSGGRVAFEDIRSFGGDRQAHVQYDGAPVVGRIASIPGGRNPLDALRRIQEGFALAEMVGGMEAVLEASVAYVKEREQFGQKIALFQAVRHQIADMGIAFTAARHLAWQAITRLDRGVDEGPEFASALAHVGRSFKELCVTAHHLHGGAGFVVEHRLHFHSERAQSLALRYAPEAPALAQIARHLLD